MQVTFLSLDRDHGDHAGLEYRLKQTVVVCFPVAKGEEALPVQ